MRKDFRQRLKNELSGKPQLEISAMHLENTIRQSRRAYECRRQVRPIGTPEMIVSQFRFIARPIWLLQGIVLLCLCFLMRYAMASEQPASYIPAFLSVSSILIAMTMLPFYGRSRKYKMREIESMTRVSLPRLILAKLCVVGMGDIVCLSFMILLTFGKMDTPFAALLLHIVIPFLLTCTASLFVMNRTKENYGTFISIGFGIGLSAVCWTIAMRMGENFVPISAGLSAFVCVCLALVLFFECRRLTRQLPSPDLQEAFMF